MATSKDKRIKKFKRKRIWPSIVGMVILVLIFAFMLLLMFEVSVLNIVQTKLGNAERISHEVALLFEEYENDDGNRNAAHELATAYVSALSEIEDVYVTNAQGECLWSCNGHEPNKDNVLQLDMESGYEDGAYNIIIEQDEFGLFVNDEKINKVVFSDELIANMNNEIIFARMSQMETLYESIMDLSMWYVVDQDDYTIYVLNRIPLYGNDLIGLVLIVTLCAILIAIFVIYYIFSFIGVVLSEHRTTKIIYTDMITGGHNWFYFIKKGTTILKRNHGRKKYAMVHLRMYKYRSFCTCFGVRRGEELLEKFYQVLRKQLRGKELIAYHENAEFGLLLAYTSQEELMRRIDALEHAIEQAMPNIKMYFGFGICTIASKEYDIEKLYNNAFTACELLGEDAERRVALFDEEMNRQRLWERKVEDDMERALAAREFKVYLQPKISAAEEKLAGAEALVRWIHPNEGFIPPNKFIPIFEQNGFILKLDDYMLEEVARQQAEWIAQGREIVPISVNVSRAHFTREDLAEHICAIVDKYKVPHDVIELELTESAFFDDKKVLLNTVRKLRENGFPVSMDDFGAGYSSLNSLKELTIDVLKIDADFFRNVEEVERGMLIVSEVIDLAKKLNMKIVAEGIESRDQVDFLVQQECDLIQGYFFAKPMPVEEFVQKYKG